ncbi:outer membrane beta-barrel protein [Hymenobacter rigui]|uniref:Outer membrane protein beta-barrel domain-containing protein n=1 Tax=Hymenobacter rigui TaxID=334424 RepID=A0A428KX11_9BACT|nr:outer membrane beta-barrel protein [Hymenobacter rigui]RSK51353.1 hypothetical protein EI291_03315 [Hymenobacter rigui]
MLKATCTIAFIAGLSISARAQDQPHKVEVGLDVVNYSPFTSGYNYFYNAYNNNKTQWLSGVTFRYNFDRFGLRAGANYTTNTDKVDGSGCADCLVGQTKGKELRLKLGGQYSPFAKAPWLYVFTDVYYRRYTSEGNFSGGFTGNQNVVLGLRSNGVGFNAGVGAKVRLLNHVHLNPEVYYDAARARNTTTNNDPASGTTYLGSNRTRLHAPAARLNLLFAF